MSLPPGLPGFSVVQSALRHTTERLARELASPRPAPPDWSPFEWDVARATASMQGITVLLANGLRWRGPDSWQSFLASQHRQALERDAHIEAVLTRLDAALHAVHAGAIALKGSALRRLAMYRPGERPMGDIDLLARPCDVAPIARALQSIDYRATYQTLRHRVFEPCAGDRVTEFGEHPRNPLKIELHECIAELLPVRRVDITAGLFPDAATCGLGAYRDEVELMRHLLLHAASNMRAHALRQVQLHDVMLLADRLAESAWDALLATPASCGGCWWMWPVLQLTQRYYPGRLSSLGESGLDRFRERCPWLLRTACAHDSLTDVSWSNLRIAAFPGMCWSRTAADALRFARSRLLPGRPALDELAHVTTAMPALNQVRWYGERHFSRVTRWVLTRPPRAQTIVSLQAARVHDHARH